MKKALLRKSIVATVLLLVLAFSVTAINTPLAKAAGGGKTLTIDIEGEGKITVVNLKTGDSTDFVSDGTLVKAGGCTFKLEAVANLGWRFLGWTGDVSDEPDSIVDEYKPVGANPKIGATFESNVGLTFEGNVEVDFEISVFDPDSYEGTPLPDGIGPYYKITILTITYSGDTIVRITYDEDAIPEGVEEANLRLYMSDPVDVNDDGTVNGNDVAAVQKAIDDGVQNSLYDVNQDGVVDTTDLLIVKKYASEGLVVNYGQDGDPDEKRLPWLDITFGDVDTVNNWIYGQTEYLSVFSMC